MKIKASRRQAEREFLWSQKYAVGVSKTPAKLLLMSHCQLWLSSMACLSWPRNYIYCFRLDICCSLWVWDKHFLSVGKRPFGRRAGSFPEQRLVIELIIGLLSSACFRPFSEHDASTGLSPVKMSSLTHARSSFFFERYTKLLLSSKWIRSSSKCCVFMVPSSGAPGGLKEKSGKMLVLNGILTTIYL